jgi:hypothetical protein
MGEAAAACGVDEWSIDPFAFVPPAPKALAERINDMAPAAKQVVRFIEIFLDREFAETVAARITRIEQVRPYLLLRQCAGPHWNRTIG